MSMPQRRPGIGLGRPGAGRPRTPAQSSASQKLDQMVKEGKITTGQAAQYRVWESAKPPIDAGRERFDAWMASRPQLPGLPPMRPAAGTTRPATWQEMDRPVLTPRRARVAPKFPTQEVVLKTVDKYERENKITEAQAELVRRWERKRPGTAVDGEGFDAWMKVRPDVPGLKEFWG